MVFVIVFSSTTILLVAVAMVVLVLIPTITIVISVAVTDKLLPVVAADGLLNNSTSTYTTGVNKLHNRSEVGQSSCTNGWYITGYFTPKETDYNGTKKAVFVHEVGKNSFYNSFLRDVKKEGAGLTVFGWYITNYGNGWAKIPYAQDSLDGAELNAGESVATDPNVIPTGTSGITIPTLPSPWNTYQYKALDTGPAVDGKHIDVYTGLGQKAKNEAFRITGYNNAACY
jgi:3D (Asp-Asp-Asp) domain-containing protein